LGLVALGCLVVTGLLIQGGVFPIAYPKKWICAFFSLLPAGCAALVIHEHLQESLKKEGRGDFDLKLSPREVAPGETIECGFRFEPHTPGSFKAIRCEFFGHERVEDPDDGEPSTHKFHSEERRETGRPLKSAGPSNPFDKTFEFRVPETDACTLEGRSHQIRWRMHAEIKVAGWDDWWFEAPVVVRPRGR